MNSPTVKLLDFNYKSLPHCALTPAKSGYWNNSTDPYYILSPLACLAHLWSPGPYNSKDLIRVVSSLMRARNCGPFVLSMALNIMGYVQRAAGVLNVLDDRDEP